MPGARGNRLAGSGTRTPPTSSGSLIGADRLRAAAMFRGIPGGALRPIADSVLHRRVARGGVIAAEGSPPGASGAEPLLHVILSGWCTVARHLIDGRELVLDVRGPGDVLGEETLAPWDPPPPEALSARGRPLAGDSTSSARATESARSGWCAPGSVALTDCELASIPAEVVVEMARRSRELHLAVVRHLAARLVEAEARLLERTLPLETRVMNALCRLDERGGEEGSGSEPSEPGTGVLDQRVLAALVGASRESVNRTLASLREGGLVELRAGRPRLIRRSGRCPFSG